MNKLLIKTLFKIPAIRNAARNAFYRSYAGAAANRLVADWIVSNTSINRDIKAGLRPVRDRARDLWKNNDYVRGARNRFRANIIGPEGFGFQSKVKYKNGNEDIRANDIIEEAWKRWGCREYCTMSGQLSFLQVQWLWSDQLKRDGEVIFRTVNVNDLEKNKFGFSIELLEPDLLDETYNDTLGDNVVIMGVELNQWRKPVAFWFRSNDIKEELSPSIVKGDLKRIPADEIIFAFDPEHSNQFRGMSHFAQSLLTFNDLGGYDQAAIINARAGASKMGVLEKDAADTEYQGDDKDENGNVISEFAPGLIEELPAGMKFKGWDPTYPHDQYPSFIKAILRKLAAGLGLAYNNWIGDLEGVNFSSMRSGLQDERDSWMLQQSMFREMILKPLFSRWLKRALFVMALDLSYSDFERLNKPWFNGRRWPWVDPLKDVQASKLAVESYLTTVSDELSKQGKDFGEIIETRKKELKEIIELKKLEKEAGLIKDNPNQNNPNQNDDEDDDEKESSKYLKAI